MNHPNQVEEQQDDARLRRMETRLTRLLLALGIDPGVNYSLQDVGVMVDLRHREIIIPHMAVTLLDCANAVMADGGDLRQGWNLVMRERTLGTVVLAE